MSNTNITNLIALAMVCLTVIFAIAMIVGGLDQEQAPEQNFPVTTPQTKENKPAYEDIVEDAYRNIYIEECNYNGADFAFCACSWDYMENELGRQGLLDMADSLTDDSPTPQVMIDATIHCMEREI